MVKLLIVIVLALTLLAPAGLSAQSSGGDAEREVSDLERRLQEFEDALQRLRDQFADEEAIARAEEMARELERKFADRAEELAQESADSMREILNELMQAVPQYAWPEITEDGDIILRRIPPGERRSGRAAGRRRYRRDLSRPLVQLLNVNVGQAAPLPGNRRRVTGIMKQPQSAAVEVGTLGLTDDAVCDTRHHGGPDQAVYVYGQPDYDWWSAELGRTLAPGTFGENLTIEGLESASVCIGDRFAGGEVLLEVTSPRIPCATLATRMGDNGFVKQFMAAERPGVYCRVLRKGLLQAGDPIDFAPYGGTRVSVLELFRDFGKADLSPATLERYLAVPLHNGERTALAARLAAISSRPNP